MDKLSTIIMEGTISAPAGVTSSKESAGKGSDKHQKITRMGRGDQMRPVLPGEHLSGRLRRALQDDIVKSFRERDLQTPFDNDIFAYLMLRIGGVAGFGAGSVSADEMRATRSANPFISLWGRAGVGGKLGISHAITEEKNIGRVKGWRKDDLKGSSLADAGNPVVLSGKALTEYQALRIGQKSAVLADKVKEWFKSGNDGLTDELRDEWKANQSGNVDGGDAGDEAESADADTDAEKTKGLISIQQGYGGFEYFVPGSTFSHAITAKCITETEFDLLMGIFYAFAQNPCTGAHSRSAMGWLNMEYKVHRQSSDPFSPPECLGTITVNSNVDPLVGDMDDAPKKPALVITGIVLQEAMARYLSLRANGFQGMDFCVGAEEERKTLINSAARASAPAGKSGKKSGKPKDVASTSAVAA